MKKNKLNCSTKKQVSKVELNKTASETEKEDKTANLDEESQGFGGWLRSDDGLDTMKLFVIANSIVLLTTLVIPHLKMAIEIAGEMIYGVEESFD